MENMTSNNEYLDFDDAVKYLKTTSSTLYKWLQTGKIPGHKLGRQWRFLKDELELHVSGKSTKINTQKDLLKLNEFLDQRKQNKEIEMEFNFNNLAENIIWDAFDHGFRNIHIYPKLGKYEIAYRSNHGLEKLTELQEETFFEIDEQFQKSSSASSTHSSRRIYLHREDSDRLQIKYQKIETLTGSRITLQIWQPEKDVVPIEKLSSDLKIIETFKKWTTRKKGLIIVSGTPGSGKTTTVYALLKQFKDKGKAVFTIEDNPELLVDGVNQIELKNKTSDEFTQKFEEVFSSDPDVVGLLINNAESLEKTIFKYTHEAILTGHIIILQLNLTNSDEINKKISENILNLSDDNIIGICTQKLLAENGKLKAHYEFYNN